MNFPLRKSHVKKINISLGLIIVFFLVLRFINLNSDVPSDISWSSALVTDEGWYSSGILRLIEGLEIIKKGDINPFPLMPIGQLLRLPFVFLFGKSLVSLRYSSVMASLLCFYSVFKILDLLGMKKIEIFSSVLFLSVSYKFFFFSRLALSEILGTGLYIFEIYFLILTSQKKIFISKLKNNLLLISISLLSGLIILTKTSFVGVVPSTIYFFIIFSDSKRELKINLTKYLLILLMFFCFYWILYARNNFIEIEYFISELILADRVSDLTSIFDQINIYLRDFVRFPYNLFKFCPFLFSINLISLIINISLFKFKVNSIGFSIFSKKKQGNYLCKLTNYLYISILFFGLPLIFGGGYTPPRYFIIFCPILTLIFSINQYVNKIKINKILDKYNLNYKYFLTLINFINIIFIIILIFNLLSALDKLTYTKFNAWNKISTDIINNYDSSERKPILAGKYSNDVFIMSNNIVPFNLKMSPYYSISRLTTLRPDYYISREIENNKQINIYCNKDNFFNIDEDIVDLCRSGVKELQFLEKYKVYPNVFKDKIFKLYKIKWN